MNSLNHSHRLLYWPLNYTYQFYTESATTIPKISMNIPKSVHSLSLKYKVLTEVMEDALNWEGARQNIDSECSPRKNAPSLINFIY